MDSKIELGDVQETLLIPLYYRADESGRDEPLFIDRKAIEIVPLIDYDFSGFDSAWALRNDVVMRTLIFDEQVAAFIQRHPDARIINLGCGLDARFWRLDNGRIVWYDLDMPDSIELRRRFLAESERNQFIAKSMFDTSWMENVAASDARPTLIVAEALFFYFDESQVKELFGQLAERFSGAEILFQSVSPGIVGKAKSVPILDRTSAQLKWGIRSGRDLANWDPVYEFINEWSLVDRHPNRWHWYRWVRIIPPVGRFLREVMKINHVRLGETKQD